MSTLPRLPGIRQADGGTLVAEQDWGHFRSKVFEGAGKLLPEVNDAVLDRLSEELAIIDKMGLLPYFSFWEDIFDYCSDHGIITGPGRGTINGLLVAACLGMTKVNALEWSLPYERFINPIHGQTPPFSVDVPGSKREQLVEYLRDKYGRAHLAALSGRPEEDNGPGPSKIFTPVGSGLVMSAQPLLPTVPTMKMRDSGDLVVDFPVKYLQNLGCIKFDIHGLKSLEILQELFDTQRGDIYPKNWNDPSVISYIVHSGDKDIFPFNSDGIRQLLKDFEPDSMEELTLVYALNRPGLIGYVSGILNLRNEQEDAYFPHVSLYQPLKSTYGYLVYKEQFMEVVTAMSGFSLAEAEDMQRVLLEDERSDDYATRFIDACEEQGIDMEVIQQVMTELIASHPFLFSKAHALGAAMIGYSIAWHKVYGNIS
jgi:DNA polymerase III subunit alpha